MPTAKRLRRAKARRGVQKLCKHKTESAASTSSGATMDLSRATEMLDSNSREATAKIKLQRVRLSRYRNLQKNRLDNFKKYMNDNFYAHTLQTYCYVCERIWWSNKLRVLKENSQAWNCVVKLGYDPKVLGFKVCGTCLNDLNHQRTPLLSTVNGFVYPEEANLPLLCPIGERLVSPRLPFMSIRHIRFFEGSKKLHGQVINVPVDVDNMVRVLPRALDDDYAFNIRIKKNLLNKSSYMSGCVSKSVIKEWLRFLLDTPLYKRHNVQIDPEYQDRQVGVADPQTSSPYKIIHEIRRQCTVVQDNRHARESGEEMLSKIQETLFWGEDYILEMAPGQHTKPLALAFDGDAEELSFPTIYYGQPREFKVPVTPFQMATSEIRRIDRRGVRSNHILYMAARIMRLKVINSFNVMFRNVRDSTCPITRERLEDPKFLRETMNRNESFLSCLPNSIQYWQRRKSDLFAMMRQLGKPTVFLTLSASEIHWVPLMKCVYRFKHHIPEDESIDDITLEEMTGSQRAELVNGDPVLCCLYFDRLVDCIVNAIKLKKGPFGKYKLIEYFRRVEFQHRGSPHCHMLLWLETAPPDDETRFVNGEHVPNTIELIDELCTVDSSQIGSERKLQTHRHTHTCFKRNTRTCRFGAPFWPMKSTRILLPVTEADRIEALSDRYKSLREILEQSESDEDMAFNTIEQFWATNSIESEDEYLNILRHGIHRPTVMYRRSMRDLMTSPFNPTISSVLQSNMDIQYIVDEYTCAAYVAEYVNKSDRGFSSLHRELVRLRDEYPDMDYEECMKEVGKRALNNIEMCVQEAAWFLLRLPMSEASRQIFFIPTQHPSERFKCKKTRQQMNKEDIGAESTDVWKKNIIERYEERPTEFEIVTLADFVANYERVETRTLNDDMMRGDEELLDEENGEEDTDYVNGVITDSSIVRVTYRKRKKSKVIKWVNFDRGNELNYKREMATLFWAFRSEELDLLNDDAYLTIYSDNEETLRARRAKYESGLRLDVISQIVRDTRDENATSSGDNINANDVFEDFVRGGGDTFRVNNQDIDSIQRETVVRTVKSAMSHEEFCAMVRKLNYRQRGLLLEHMTRLIYGGEPLQIFFCGPAGSGKTFLLKAMMEASNRFTARRNTSKCAYLACATTGKAAVNVDGTTIHSALKIPITSREGARMPFDKLQTMRCDLSEVCTIIIDEVSMMSHSILNRVGDRLKACGRDSTDRFGGFHVIFCGDLRQLPPVNAKTVYSRPANMLQDQMLWHNLGYYPLVDVMRQSDKEFSDILTKIGDGRKLNDFERTLIESRFFDSEFIESCDELKPAIRLFHRNAQVDDYNYKRLAADTAGMTEVLAEDIITGCANNHQRTSTLQKLNKMENTATGYLPRRLCLVLGTPYMVTQNLNTADRIVNGAIGILKHIETTAKNGKEYVSRIWLLFDDPACGAKIRLKYQQHMVEHKIDRRYTPFVRRELPINIKSRLIKVKRRQFPLLPSNAQTIHKVQGASFNMVVYEYDRSHELALVYVALSRARSLQGLFLTNCKKDHRFRHCMRDNCRVELQNEFKRLETKQVMTIYDRCNSFVSDATKNSEVSIASFNVQSVRAHSNDISADDVLKNTYLLVLSETWMHGTGGIGCGDTRNDCESLKLYQQEQYARDGVNFNHQYETCLLTDHNYGASDDGAIPIEGFRCVTRSRRDTNKIGGGGVAIYESLKSNFTACHHVDVNTVKSPYGDVCCAFMKYKDKYGQEQMISLIAFYCQPNITGQKLMDLVDESMWRFTRGTMALQLCRRGDLYWCPLIVCGDFNYNFAGDSQASVVLQYLKNTHGLEYMNRNMGPTNRSGSSIDAVFMKRSPLELMYYTIYFSTHRGMLIATKCDRKRKKQQNRPGIENASPLTSPVVNQAKKYMRIMPCFNTNPN